MQSYYTHSPEAICQSLERWSSWTHQDIESDKTIIDTVNALVVVAAFIAGVQSQIITFTIQLSQNPLGRAANATAFIGLLLDVIGTFLGVIHAIVLQRRIKDNTALLNAMTEISKNLRLTQRIINSSSSPDKLTQDQLRDIGIINDEDDDDGHPQQHLRKAQQLHDVLKDRFRGRSGTGPFAIALDVLHAVIFPTLGKDKVETMVKSLFALGHTPLFAMAVGVVSLVVSIVLYAAGSKDLQSEVWISCVGVIGGIIGLSLLPITYEKAKNYFFPGLPE